MAKTGKNMPRPKATGTKIRVQVVLEKDIVEKVDHYAERFGMSRSYFCAQAIAENVGEDAWMHNIVLSPVMKPVMALCRKLVGEKNKKKREEYMAILDHMTRENLDEL
jgi:metal-responsive CopG/Arc/MetJ family transcriptional regulator